MVKNLRMPVVNTLKMPRTWKKAKMSMVYKSKNEWYHGNIKVPRTVQRDARGPCQVRDRVQELQGQPAQTCAKVRLC